MIYDGNPMGNDGGDRFLTFTDVSGSPNAFRLDKTGTVPDRDIRYSLDGGRTWTAYGWTGNTGDSVAVRPYGSVKWLGMNTSIAAGTANYLAFASTGAFNASGSIMSIIDGTGNSLSLSAEYAFCYLFRNCAGLVSAPELPATALAAHCYQSMFSGCTGLVSAPALPATALAEQCYRSMFSGCTGLVSAPALPATALAEQCYRSMFDGCAALTSAPELPATTLASYCYQSMFSGCAALTAAPELPATTLAAYCYYTMFSGCSSMSTAPSVLPALSVPNQACRSMFGHCSSLTAGPEIMATSFSGSGNGALYSMFNDCPLLSSLTVHFTSWDGSGGSPFSSYWLNGVSATGTFTCPAGLDTTVRDASHVPEGWTVVTDGSDSGSESGSESQSGSWSGSGSGSGSGMPTDYILFARLRDGTTTEAGTFIDKKSQWSFGVAPDGTPAIGNSSSGSGYAIRFDVATRVTGRSPVTLSAWFYDTSGTSNSGLMGLGTRSYNYILSPELSNATSVAFPWGESWAGTAFASGNALRPPSGAWHHVAITFDMDYVRWYTDGTLVGTSGDASGLSIGGSYLYLGSRVDDSRYFIGYIRNYAVYSRALSGAEIAGIYSAGID